MHWRAEWLGLVARVVVGGVWLVAGALKMPDPAASVRSVRAYQLLPESIVPLVGHALPVLEMIVGACLVLGLLTRLTGALSALMLCAFVVGITAAWARGLQIECGCFGGGTSPSANASAAYPWDIARDVGLMLLSLWLVWRPATPWSADNRLLPVPPTASTHPAR